MAGLVMPTAFAALAGTALGYIAVTVPAGKSESICLMACLAVGSTADGYINVYDYDGVANKLIMFQEPVRYRQPGGNVTLLLNYILYTGHQIAVEGGAAGQNLAVTLFNRWQFDA